ncbi:hypothetical protein IFM61606_04189 [Aspergillus udagawae]|uniref:Small ribosomal subunit protein mS38 n=1 Tax=Aspergillus udagawae TaxID=91492 RepID=A0ABQ1AJZ3_9EURO|nr:hypothetical protein IFM51744_07470 [Aspergillus udagawae]GFF83283.1 hypothetical protein IFM53868_03757 [Aspergillus udagawae]GFG14043.1 hypothetical protein IFM5058_06752 [Aspergillus udagawae]GFG24285.1 hypothetical protein IFM61606_04189 [Aspergillus udagawae]
MINSDFEFAFISRRLQANSLTHLLGYLTVQMLPSSVRRAVWTPIVPISGISRTSSQALASSSNGLLGTTEYVRQRRYSSSSSKPSDGSRNIDASSQTPAKGVNSGDKREGKSSKRRGKDGRNGSKSNQHAAFSRLPSVPSTQHLQPHDVHVASFFSIHRPISVSTTVPPPSSAEAFDAIFTPKKPSKPDTADVILTLSSAVHNMENAAYNLGEQEDQMNILSRGFNEAEGLDGMNMSELRISIEELTKRLRPFQPPPPPVPYDEAKDASAAEETSSFSTVLTIHESTYPDGRKTYQAHASPFVPTQDLEAPGAGENDSIIDIPHGSENSYIERLRDNNTMHAISTRRRRKLKMKKHKFKKLLRRTRTLRRKLDKA